MLTLRGNEIKMDDRPEPGKRVTVMTGPSRSTDKLQEGRVTCHIGQITFEVRLADGEYGLYTVDGLR